MKDFMKTLMKIGVKIKLFFFIIFRGFSRLELKRKIFLFLFMGLFLATLWLLVGTLTGGWLKKIRYTRLSSLESLADKVYDFDLSEVLRFDAIFPPQTFSILIEKVVVNLKPGGIHLNPMGVFQIYLKVDSKKTAIQLRNMRQNVSDKIQREIEGLTYDEVTQSGGKEYLKSLIRENVNKILTQGHVQEVYFKTIIIKP